MIIEKEDLMSNVKKTKSGLQPNNDAQQQLEGEKLKQDFINNYGVTIQMPAHYIFETFFYNDRDQEYIINACCQVFPDNLHFYDFDKIIDPQMAHENDFLETQTNLSNILIFQVYKKMSNKYQQVAIRPCDQNYQTKICFSPRKQKVAIFRKEVDPYNRATYVIDIFDSSKKEFYIDDQPLTPENETRMFTIRDGDQTFREKHIKNCFLRFSQNERFLLVQRESDQVLIYDLQQTSKLKDIIDCAALSEQLPEVYDAVINMAINEEDINQSIIAAKRRDFNNIDIFSIATIKRVQQELTKSKDTSEGADSAKILNLFKANSQISTIKLSQYDRKTTFLKFSADHKSAIYCDKTQNLLLSLANGNVKQRQKDLTHLNGERQRYITRFEQGDFLVATADTIDNQITIRHTSDTDKKIKYYLRFVEGVVKVRDLTHERIHKGGSNYIDKIKVIITRDDEEFVIYEFEDFKYQTFWQRFYQSSNYIFEWPYLCYINGQRQIIIQNGFSSDKAIYLEPKLKDYEQITDIYLTDSFNLYYIVNSKDSYQIYERDLDKIMQVLLKKNQKNEYDGGSSMKAFSQGILDKVNYSPIAVINKSHINNKAIYKFLIRSSSRKDYVYSNLERLIFFICDYKIYQVNKNNQITYIDDLFKIKQISSSLYAYNTLENGKPTNEIKFIRFGFSEYETYKVHEEAIDDKIIEFLCQEKQIIIVTKKKSEQTFCLKFFDIVEDLHVKFRVSIMTSDTQLIKSIEINDGCQNNMVPSGNDMYVFYHQGDTINIQQYKDIVPLDKANGEQMLFISPIMNHSYRKMIYFICNKKQRKEKTAYILPYINDNFIVLNKRENLTQFCQFYTNNKPFKYQPQINILNIVPYSQQIQHYVINGQLVETFKLKQLFQKHGDHNLCISTDGNNFLQHHQNDKSFSSITIIKIGLEGSYENKAAVGANTVQEEEKHEEQQESRNSLAPPKLSLTKSVVSSIKRNNSIFATKDEEVKLSDITIDNLDYILGIQYSHYQNFDPNEIQKFKTLPQLIQFYQSHGCEVQFKMNNNLDVAMCIFHTQKINKQQIKYIKEMFVLRKIEEVKDGKKTTQRKLIRVQIQPLAQIYVVEQKQEEEDEDDKKVYLTVESNASQRFKRNLTRQLMKSVDEEIKAVEKNQQKTLQQYLMKRCEYHSCFDFNITNEKVIMWSRDRIYVNSIVQDHTLQPIITLAPLKFQIGNQDESYIQNIACSGAKKEDDANNNYYIYIKIIVDEQYSVMIKYNLIKDKEFSQFDCSKDAMTFFDHSNEGYILDEDSIIDYDQGIPLYYYQTGTKDVNTQYVLGGSLDKGSRFCFYKEHFIVKNKLYIPYSYLSLVIIQNTYKQKLDLSKYNPVEVFSIDGNTILHRYAGSFKDLDFIFTEYEKFNPKLFNLILIKNKEKQNVLDIALEQQNSRCVNLILEKLSFLSINNIHSIKEQFAQLLNYNGFENYLKLCLYQNKQMETKKVFKRITEGDERSYVGSHNTSFFDQQFFSKFQDPTQTVKPVNIKCMDAGWLIKHNDGPGQKFLIDLSQNDNMKYFELDTIRLIVNYQWKILKPKIIKYLFFPFLINMIMFNLYCLFILERQIDDADDKFINGLSSIFKVVLLLFSVQTFYIEYKQITFHRKLYFQSFWNLLDLTVVVMTPLIVILYLIKFDIFIVRSLMAICNLTFYLRCFYFMRIFDNSAHLVRTIIEITYDIRYFIFVFILAITGFGASFYILSNNIDTAQGQEEFISNFWMSFIYSYRLSLGDFDTEPYSKTNNLTLLWVLFIICSLFTAIIQLNMLVAIMGEAFNRVNEQSENQRVREHLQLIVENDFLIDRGKAFKDAKYLIEIRDDTDDDLNDITTQYYEQLLNQMKQQDQRHKEEIQSLKQMMISNSSQIIQCSTELKNDMARIKKMLEEQKDNEGVSRTAYTPAEQRRSVTPSQFMYQQTNKAFIESDINENEDLI